MKDVLRRTISEAKSATSKVRLSRPYAYPQLYYYNMRRCMHYMYVFYILTEPGEG